MAQKYAEESSANPARQSVDQIPKRRLQGHRLTSKMLDFALFAMHNRITNPSEHACSNRRNIL